MKHFYHEISYNHRQCLTHREMFLDKKYAIQDDGRVLGWVSDEEVAKKICMLLDSDIKCRDDVYSLLESRLSHITDAEADNNRLKHKVVELSAKVKELQDIIDWSSSDVILVTW